MAWDLPRPIQTVRDRILKQPKGDRAFVELLMLAGEAGLDALTVACELALEGGIVSAPIVMNELRRLIAPHLPKVAINPPELGEPGFGNAPEAFDAVDVVVAYGKFVVAVVDTEVLGTPRLN